jgi:hypothetical protein
VTRNVKRLVLALFLAAMTVPGAWAGDIHVLYGRRTVNDDFDPVGGQRPHGVQWFIGKPGHVALLLGYFKADEDDSYIDLLAGVTREEARFSELSLGFAKMWGRGSVRPYLGVGTTRLRVKDERTVVSTGIGVEDSDSITTVYGNGGLILRISKNIEVGADVRYVPRANLDLFGADVDGDYRQYSAFVGLGW